VWGLALFFSLPHRLCACCLHPTFCCAFCSFFVVFFLMGLVCDGYGFPRRRPTSFFWHSVWWFLFLGVFLFESGPHVLSLSLFRIRKWVTAIYSCGPQYSVAFPHFTPETFFTSLLSRSAIKCPFPMAGPRHLPSLGFPFLSRLN